MNKKTSPPTSASRRKFMKSAALSAAGIMIVPRHVLGGPGYTAPSDKVNVGVVGVGGRGRRNVEALLQLDEVQVTAIADPAEYWELYDFYYQSEAGRGPVKEMIDLAHEYDAPVLLDGAQSVPHMAVDVQELDCDFFVFSGHKVFGPTGIGVLYGKEALLEDMPPYQGGGDMILSVTFDKTVFNELPFKFEAGTPNIAGTIGLGEALNYLSTVGFDAIGAHEDHLLRYATEQLKAIEGLRIIGTAAKKASLVSFDIEGVHPHDIGQFLDFEGLAVRTGHHCTQPVMDRFEVPATTRASFALYNTTDEIDRLVAGLKNIVEIFKG